MSLSRISSLHVSHTTGLIALVLLRWRLPDDQPQFAARGMAASYDTATDAPDFDAADPNSADPSDDISAARAKEQDADLDSEPPRLKWTDMRLRPWIVAQLLGGHAQAMVLGISGFLVLDRLDLRAAPTEGAGPVGLVLMSGALASLLSQWGIIPRFKLGPRAATLWGMAAAIGGIALLSAASQIHVIALGYAIASLGFGLFRPGTTAGTSLAVTRAEQGQASGVVASIAGASFIYAPALGVWLYGLSDWYAFGLIIGLCLIALGHGALKLQADEDLTR